MELFRRAGFSCVFIDIESPEEKSAEEIGKIQNMRQDILSSVRNVYRHGIDVLVGITVHFDNDTLDAFSLRHRFITSAGTQVAMVEACKAFYRWLVTDRNIPERIANKGRLLHLLVYQPNHFLSQGVELVGRFITGGLLPGGPHR